MAVSSNLFQPTRISGLQLWLDASDQFTLFQDYNATAPANADGDPIGCWKDKSGNGRNAIWTDGLSKSNLKIGTKNLKNTLSFNAFSNLKILNVKTAFNFLHASQGTVFIIFRTNPSNSNPNTIYALLDSNGVGSNYSGYSLSYDDSSSDNRNNSLISCGGTDYATNYYIHSSNDLITAGSWYVVTNKLKGIDDTASNRTLVYVNGVLDSAVNANTGTYTGDATLDFFIGAAKTDYWRFNGNIAEIIIYDTALSDSNRTTVESYLNSKWGVY